MALTTPILYSVPAFDAANSHTFAFIVQSGDQVVANRLIIKNNETLAEVYNQKIDSFGFSHTVPANTLTNGVYYQATITTYNAAGDASQASTPVQFYCYTTPTLLLSNLPNNNIINSGAFVFEATYNQAEGELLNNYSFTLYDVQGVQVATSGARYVGKSAEPPTTVSYTFAGLIDGTSYYIQANGQTINGTTIESTRALISVKYLQPETSLLINLSNNCQDGYITIQSNFVLIDGVANPRTPTYVDDNTAIDLTADGSYVVFDSGYSINGDFTALIWGRDFTPNSTILEFSDTNGCKVEVRYMEEFFAEDGEVYVDCLVTSNDIKYYIYSPNRIISAGDNCFVVLVRVGTLYDIGLDKITQ